jgi:hypothetical protein
MKVKITIISASGIIGGLSLAPFNAAQAIEPPPDEAQPPAASQEQENSDTAPVARQEALPFIGVATATLPDMVAAHLDIEPGHGVIVRTVCPDSPAEKAGLSVNDIILSMGGKKIGDPDAVTAIVRDHKIGDRLALDLIHKGKPAKMEIRLGERPADMSAQLDQEPLLDGIPKDHADRLRGLIEQNLGAFGQGEANGGMFPEAQLNGAFRLLRERMQREMDQAPRVDPDARDGGIHFQQHSTIRMMDNEGSVEVKSSGESTEVTVRDTDNNIAWTGPWDTDQDKAAAPEGIRERIERVNGGAGKSFTFRFRNLKPDPAPDSIDN